MRPHNCLLDDRMREEIKQATSGCVSKVKSETLPVSALPLGWNVALALAVGRHLRPQWLSFHS